MDEIAIVLRTIAEASDEALNQRTIAERTKVSLGKANSLVKEAIKQGLAEATGDGLTKHYSLTEAGWACLAPYRVDNAIILAAGFGSRFVPFTYDTPKGLLKVNGQPMIERQIEQLHAAQVTDITIVVGYLKEEFDYLIDKYGVTLVYNPEYATKNNFASVYYVLDRLKNTYLLVSDDWIRDSVFHTWEPASWISCIYFAGPTKEWGVTTGVRDRITKIETRGEDTWALVGPAYFTADFSEKFAHLVKEAYGTPGTDGYYWEHILASNLKELAIYCNKQDSDNIWEFENLEELRAFDTSYNQATGNAVMTNIAAEFGVPEGRVVGIEPLKEGASNLSFLFRIEGDDQRYVFRRPGVGTDKLINRRNEKQVYELLKPLQIADDIVSFDADSGDRITRYWEGARVSDPFDDADLDISMRLVKSVHDRKLTVANSFDIARMIDYYHGLCAEADAIRFSDFDHVAQEAQELLDFRNRLAVPEVLCHGDFLYANVLILPDSQSRLIDWEFGGMADPIMDVAMYGIYSYFDQDRQDLSLRLYLGREPRREETARLYLYTALGGFLWMMWAEYKQALGQEFGEYPLIMYRYMKDYYRLLKNGGYLA